MRTGLCVVLVLASPLALAAQARGQSDAPPPPPDAAPPASKGLLPIPDYTQDFKQRRDLTGDWGGTRTDLANKGVQFDLDWTQVLQGVADGGRDQKTRYGGNLDYLLNLDLMRMGVMDGALLKVRAETRYGESVNGIAGPILPVNTDALFPLTDRLDKDIPFTITNFLYTQFLSEKFAVFLGKMDTLDGDPNEFASGRGTSQFMNANFNFNATLGLRLPYSTLGAGVVVMPAKGITITSAIMNTADSSTNAGFDDFGDGMTWTGEADFQYRIKDLPGGQNVGFLYSFDQEFSKINGRLVFQPGEGLSALTDDKTWAVYWSGWQYLWVKDPSDAPISLANGEPDHKGIGLFARAGLADKDTNPVEWSASGGIGGRGIIPSRDNDTFGVGYFYNSFQTTRLSGIANIEDSAGGFEGFYNIAITPAAHCTFDVQVVDSPAGNVDQAIVVGARLKLEF